MTVGTPPTTAGISQTLSSLAVQLREIMKQVCWLQMQVSGLGQEGLEGLGFSAEDATAVAEYGAYLANVAGCYYGTVQQGGTGGTGAILFNFEDALCPLWP